MAKTNEQFDQHFKEKLDGHREKPSALAWERLESQLPKQPKPAFGIWWAIAASVTALLVAGYSFWPTEEVPGEESFVAAKTELPIETPFEETTAAPAGTEVSAQPEEKTETPIQEKKSEEKPKTNPKTKPTPTPVLTQTPQNLIAEAENKSKESPIVVPIPELKTDELPVAMPELKTPDLEKTVAQASPQEDEEPLYRVNIYSNGVKKGETPDKNIINELGKTVGQVEGFLGKVDEGLITLQDKKDNLFATLTTKKNQAEEKR